MAGLQITGRHALLFDDDASATFVDSSATLVPWAADSSLLIDRYDARHLLDRVPLRPKPGYVHKSEEDVAEEMVLDRERYLDLQAEDLPSNDTQVGIQDQGEYTSVPFCYENTREDKKDESDYKMEISSSPYRPPFALPENLLNHIPPSEKVHQIISRTAKFVSEHGGQSEIVLRVKQGNNPTFGFLMPDHHLHPYFQYLIQNPNLLKSDPSKPNPNGGALSLLGSVYGSGEDDDVITPPSNPSPNPSIIENPKNEDLESEEKNPKALLTRNPSIIKVKDPVKLVKEEVKLVKEPVKLIEPDSVMENAMEKIAEFVLRNGRELEKVLIEQDKGINRFLFLVPTNAYHAYYLKVLEEVKEGKRSEQSTKNQETKSCTKNLSRESTPSDQPKKHDKFKMVLSKPSKTKTDPNPTNQNAAPVLTTQEVSAIVQAATRGKSPSFWSQAKTDPGLTSQSQTRPVKDNDDDAWISKAIKKTAELVSSDVSLSLSKESNKEEKVKAERLKRAKKLSGMIKSSGGGPQLSELLNKVTKVDDDNENRGEMSKREKEECEVMRHRDGSKHELKKYRKRNDSSDAEERESNERKKRDKDDERRRHRKKHHSSSDEEGEIRERKRGKHSDDRKRRHKERDYDEYSDEERERRERKRRHHKERDYDDYKSSERRTKDWRVGSTSTRDQSSEVPDELRAKIRAMLLQTL